MKITITKCLLIISISLIFLSCSESPEEYGKKLAAKGCGCKTLAKQNAIEISEQLLNETKAGSIKTEKQFNDRGEQLSTERHANDHGDEVGKCWKEYKEMDDARKVKYVKEDERLTLENTIHANLDACDRELNKKLSDNFDAARKLMNIPTEWDAARLKMQQDSINVVRISDSLTRALKK